MEISNQSSIENENNGEKKMKTDIDVLIKAMIILSCDIISDDGIANSVIAEAAERLLEMKNEIENLKLKIKYYEMIVYSTMRI